jgi:glycosyltransferase involved in cell wall biosynthesis
MTDAGWKVMYYPKASVYHYVGGSSEKSVFRSVIEFHKSVYRLFEKYLDSSLSFFKPMVFGGLAVRILLVLLTHLIERGIKTKVQSAKCKVQSVKSGKIKILRVISRLNIGGPAIHVCLLTNGLNPDKFESKLVTGKISPQEGDMGYLFDTFDNKPILIPDLQREINLFTDIRAFFHIFKLLFREEPDIVDTHTAKAGTSARMAVIIYNRLFHRHIRLIHTFHGHVFEGYFSRISSLLFVYIERFLARSTDVIIVISTSQQKELSEKYHIAPISKIRTVQLGFDLHPFILCKSSFRGKFRQSLGIDEDTLLIGIIGRLVPIKNHRMFFMAAKKLLEKLTMPVKFIVVGDGELRSESESFCRDSGLENHVVFCGWIKNVPYVYADLDILALTSLNEGTPVSIIESMAASVPVIATDVGGVGDLLGNPSGGFQTRPYAFQVCDRGILCRRNDADSFAEGLYYLATEDTGLQAARVCRAREFAEEHFHYQRLFKDMESLYLNVMADGRNRT